MGLADGGLGGRGKGSHMGGLMRVFFLSVLDHPVPGVLGVLRFRRVLTLPTVIVRVHASVRGTQERGWREEEGRKVGRPGRQRR